MALRESVKLLSKTILLLFIVPPVKIVNCNGASFKQLLLLLLMMLVVSQKITVVLCLTAARRVGFRSISNSIVVLVSCCVAC